MAREKVPSAGHGRRASFNFMHSESFTSEVSGVSSHNIFTKHLHARSPDNRPMQTKSILSLPDRDYEWWVLAGFISRPDFHGIIIIASNIKFEKATQQTGQPQVIFVSRAHVQTREAES